MAIYISGTTGISGVDGSAGTPAVQGTDTNTGVFYPAADTVGVSTGGSERVRVDSSGNVGIGTSSPSSYANYTSLTINGTDVDIDLLRSGTRQFALYTTSALTAINNVANLPLYFYTNNTNRMILDTSGNLQFNSGYGSVATAYGCRAWVNFNGTGTIAIRASGNVSSITDGGVGIYRVNFTSSMPDANFTTVASSAGAGSVNNSTTAMLVNATSSTAQTANAAYVDVWCYHPGNQVAQDDAYINVSVFR